MLRKAFVCAYLLYATLSFAQHSISGKITNEENQALVGANVVLKGTITGTVTDLNGSFKLNVLNSGAYVLHISYVGFDDIVETLQLNGDLTREFKMIYSSILGDEVIIKSTRAGLGVPVANTLVGKEEISGRNLGQDLPMLLSTTPSFVVSSDAGAGVGYTSFRIRGSDANRVNITFNGIPVNDAESHGVWWVNMPDFSSSLNNVQIQRGVGTSTNGAGAFGASINMQTSVLEKKAYTEISSSAGSFNTFKNTFKAGTGLIKDHFAFDVRLSKINSDGFIDRASSDLKSFYTSGAYYGEKTTLKLNIFSGAEHTYQAWNGVPSVRLNNDYDGMQRYADHWLISQEQADQMMASDSRTYNIYTYENETDNYQQDHYQLFFSHKITADLDLNLAAHYTYGRGYYEQYKEDRDLEDYKMTPPVYGSDTITSTDLIQQKWLDNDFYGTTFSVNYSKDLFDFSVGGAWNQYDGRHYGKVIWARTMGEAEKGYEWYRSTGIKTDYNFYGKINMKPAAGLNIYADMQGRFISYKIDGFDDDLRDLSQEHTFSFFNPKLGVLYNPSTNHQVYVYGAIANREPTRSNYTDADPDKPNPTSEKLTDLELGYSYTTHSMKLGLNAYYMYYNDQLILTGEINDVGSPVMVNVDKSYRAGFEAIAAFKFSSIINWDLNASFSENKINNFTEYVDNWDTWGQDVTNLGKTDIAFSPNIVGNSHLQLTPIKNFQIGLISQYVSKQFTDNTSNSLRVINAYFVNNFLASYTFKPKFMESIELNLLINNLFDTKYESNAWVYSYIVGGERYAMDGYFPQAGINFMAGINLRF